MALIEGVGDEVTLLFGVVFLLFVLVLAWASTHTAEPPDHLVSSSSVPSAEPESQEAHPSGDITSPPHSSREDDDKTEAGAERGAEGHGGSAEAAEEASLLGADGLRHRGVPGPSLSTQPPTSASSATQASASEDVPNNTERNMILRLKFLNDTERMAQVNSEDTIGYIKRYILCFFFVSSVPDYAPCKRAVTIQRIEARAFVRS